MMRNGLAFFFIASSFLLVDSCWAFRAASAFEVRSFVFLKHGCHHPRIANCVSSNFVSSPPLSTMKGLQMAYLGDEYDSVDSRMLASEEVSNSDFIAFENPQQIWPLQALEEPPLAAGRLLVLLSAAIYGTNFASVKLLNDIMPTGVSAVARFGLAALTVSALVWHSEDREASLTSSLMIQEQRREATWLGVEIGGWYSVAYLAQAAGLMTVDASKSAFFNALAVVVVPLLDSFFKGKKISSTMLAAISLAIAGVGMLQLGPSASTSETVSVVGAGIQGGSFVSTGDMLSFAQCLFFGIGYWRLEAGANKFPNQAPRMTAGQLVGVAIGSLVYCIFSGQVPDDVSTVLNWMTGPFVLQGLLWTGLISTALALYLETVALKVVSATELTVLMTSVSVWGSAFAFFTMGEVLHPIGMAGGALILSSCILSATSSSNSDEEDATAIDPNVLIVDPQTPIDLLQ